MADLKPKLKKSTNEGGNEDNIVKPDFNEETPDFQMLAGYRDDNGDIHRSFTIREMTGRDEEAISRPDVKQNGSKVINTILERCVLSIGKYKRANTPIDQWKKIIQGLLVPDQDYILIKIRTDSLGDDVEISHICPKCGKKLISTVSLSELETVPFHGNREIPFELPKGYTDKKGTKHRTGIMRLSTGFDREILTPVASKNLSKANTLLLTRLCKFDDDYIITEDVMTDLTLKDREYLLNLLSDNNIFGIVTSVDITCTECEHTFSGNLNATNFI